jgi:integration host factor subunit beta
MTKAELVEEVSKSSNLSKKDAEIVVQTVLNSIVESLKKGEKVELRGFGSFRIRSRQARQGRNPKTGNMVKVPAKRVPYFKPGKELRELINQPVASPAPTTTAPTTTPTTTP